MRHLILAADVMTACFKGDFAGACAKLISKIPGGTPGQGNPKAPF